MHASHNRFELPGTDRTPHLLLDPSSGTLSITGCSIPENADRFYGHLHDVLDLYLTAPAPRSTVRITLTYFNSSSAKYLLDILKRFDDVHHAKTTQVTLEWCYAKEDLDMQEAGQDFKALLEFPTKLIEQR